MAISQTCLQAWYSGSWTGKTPEWCGATEYRLRTGRPLLSANCLLSCILFTNSDTLSNLEKSSLNVVKFRSRSGPGQFLVSRLSDSDFDSDLSTYTSAMFPSLDIHEVAREVSDKFHKRRQCLGVLILKIRNLSIGAWH